LNQEIEDLKTQELFWDCTNLLPYDKQDQFREWLQIPNASFKRIYRGSEDGFLGIDWRRKCSGIP
jgi:hypothetical protein